jgi:phosphatidylglycerophosphatase A
MRNKVILFFASGLGLGYLPLVPGTWGTVLGVAVYFFLGRMTIWAVVPIVVGLMLVSFWLADQAEQILITRDPQVVVIDEVVGYLITMISFSTNWRYLLAGFFLFRFFDIVKIWPASWFDKSGKRGFAVVMDDVAAGVYANIVMQVIRLVTHWS